MHLQIFICQSLKNSFTLYFDFILSAKVKFPCEIHTSLNFESSYERHICKWLQYKERWGVGRAGGVLYTVSLSKVHILCRIVATSGSLYKEMNIWETDYVADFCFQSLRKVHVLHRIMATLWISIWDKHTRDYGTIGLSSQSRWYSSNIWLFVWYIYTRVDMLKRCACSIKVCFNYNVQKEFYGICTLDYTFMVYAHFYRALFFFSPSYGISSLFYFLLLHKLRDIYLVFMFANIRIFEV